MRCLLSNLQRVPQLANWQAPLTGNVLHDSTRSAHFLSFWNDRHQKKNGKEILRIPPSSLCGCHSHPVLYDVQRNCSRYDDPHRTRPERHSNRVLPGIHLNKVLINKKISCALFNHDFGVGVLQNYRLSLLFAGKCVHQQADASRRVVHHKFRIRLSLNNGIRFVWDAFVLDLFPSKNRIAVESRQENTKCARYSQIKLMVVYHHYLISNILYIIRKDGRHH